MRYGGHLRCIAEQSAPSCGQTPMARNNGLVLFYDAPGPASSNRLFAVLVAISIATSAIVVSLCIATTPAQTQPSPTLSD